MVMINYEFFNKTNMLKFFEYQFKETFTVIVFALVLVWMKHTKTNGTTPKPIPFMSIVASMLILLYYSYFIHRLIHKIPPKYNFHTMFHHSKNATDFWINLLIEFIINALFFVGVYCLKLAFNLSFIPTILIVFYGIIYTSVHIINYSIFHLGKNHREHHLSVEQKCNFGPDTIDHLLNTNCNSNYENLTHVLPNILGAFLICYGVQTY